MFRKHSMATKFITVSVEIMRDQNLNQSQKFLLAEIEQLTTLEKGCIASNLHFSNLIGITKENVSRNINDLQKKGYIYTEIVSGSRNHTRIITLTTLVRPPYQNSKTPLLKQQETIENKPTNKPTNKTKEKSLSKIKPKGFKYPEVFDLIWMHNRKGDKWKAYRAYYPIRFEYSIEKLQKALQIEASKTYGRRDTSTVFNGDIDDLLLQEQSIKTHPTFKSKEPQVGSLEWKRQQQLKQQEETIDAELIQTS